MQNYSTVNNYAAANNKLDLQSYDKLLDQIAREYGFNCKYYREEYMKRRIRTRMDRLKISSYRDYSQLLKKDSAESIELMNCIGVNVSEFFRDIYVFDMIMKKIIPEIVRNKTKEKINTLNVWSCCCATGEEAYSLAIMLQEFLCNSDSKLIPVIEATDIDEEALGKARVGEYDVYKLKNAGRYVLDTYFRVDENTSKYVVLNFLREMVRFSKLNVISEGPLRCIDLLFCRNMLIYIKKEYQGLLFENLYKSLNQGGYLVLGNVETLADKFKERFELVSLAGRIYRKIK